MNKKEVVLVVGLGEVGAALFEVLNESGKFDVYGFDVDIEKTKLFSGGRELPKTIDVMHLCFPCTRKESFVKATIDLIKRFCPKLVVVESTVSPGTTREIYEATHVHIAHSPILGMHETRGTMKEDIRYWPKYVGGTTDTAAKETKKHFKKLGLTVVILKGSTESELAKLFETTYRAWMIACFQEMHRIALGYNASFLDAIRIVADVHRVRRDRPIFFPSVIGGHCLIPNAELLLKSYNSDFLRVLLASNEKRKREIRDPKIRQEVEQAKKLASDVMTPLDTKPQAKAAKKSNSANC